MNPLGPSTWSEDQIRQEIAEQSHNLETAADGDKCLLSLKLCEFWSRLFYRKNEGEQIDNAIMYGRLAIETYYSWLPEEERPEWAQVFCELQEQLHLKARTTDKDEDWEEFINVSEDALAKLPHKEDWWWEVYKRASDGFLNRYRRTGDAEDARLVVNTGYQAMRTPEYQRHFTPRVRDNLARALLCKAQLDGSLEHLQDALQLGYDALGSVISSESVFYCGELLMCLYTRYEINRESDELEEALRIGRLARQLPQNSHGMETVLYNYSMVLLAKYRRHGHRADVDSVGILEEAITSARSLVEIEERTGCLLSGHSLLGRCLGTRFGAFKEIEDADESVAQLETALSLLPNPHPDRAEIQNDIAATLERKFKLLRNQDRIDEAAACLEEALAPAAIACDLTSETEAVYAERACNFATLFAHKYDMATDKTAVQQQLSLARDIFCAAAMAPNSTPRSRINAATRAGRFLLKAEQWEKADKVLAEAIELLPRVVISSMSSEDQQDLLQDISGLGTYAAEAALQNGRPAWQALQRLEAARCVVSETGMKQRSDLRELERSHPDLAYDYKLLRDQISRRIRVPETEVEYLSSRDVQERRLRAIRELEENIRTQPGFEQFQHPMAEADFKMLAEFGPIVVFNIGWTRSDIFVVKTESISTLSLEFYDTLDLRSRVESLCTASGRSQRNGVVRERRATCHTIESLLQWIWDIAVERAVDCALEGTDPKTLRRIWWITSGLFGSVPFHLAGDETTNNTFSRCISSYISSFKALRYAREKANTLHVTKDSPALLITMPTTPGPHEALNTEIEESIFKNVFHNNVPLERPSRNEILDTLSPFSFVHLACHGVSMLQDPSRSGIVLLNNDKDQASILTVADLEKVDLEAAFIAYLSACSTAEIGSGKLRDEAIHLTNSFQMIGFPHVIGSIWPAYDRAAGEIASGFYKGLMAAEDITAEGVVAKALHDAMLEFRSKENDVAKWGPFVHIGI